MSYLPKESAVLCCEPRAEALAGPTPVVLIVDDDASLVRLLASLVEDCGYIPIIAYDGVEALQMARLFRPDLILTDLVMPRATGAELIENVRAEAATDGWPAPATVLLSSSSRHSMRAVDADVRLSKPFDIETIEGVLHRFLG